jgi:nicotinamidase-related amidase
MTTVPIPEKINDYPLVVIDVVKGCCNKQYEITGWDIHFSKIRKMLPRLNNFVKKHRDNGGQVIWIKPTPWTRENLPDNINKLYSENPDATFYVKDHIEEYNEFPRGIMVDERDVVLEKNNYSAFTNPRLIEYLDDAYLIAGVYSDGCVNATIVEGWSKGYFTYILGDLVESMDSETKQNQKTQLLKFGWPYMYGHVIQSEDLYKNRKTQ